MTTPSTSTSLDSFRSLDGDYKPSDISAMIEETQNPKDIQELETFWKEEIRRAEQLREKIEPRWRAARKAYRNRWYPNTEKGKENISNPTFYSDIEVAVSNTAANLPKVLVQSQRKEFDPQASMVRAGLTSELDRLKIKSLSMNLAKDAFIYNHAILKVGYNVYEYLNLEASSAFIARTSVFDYIIDPEANSQETARYEGEQRFLDEDEFKAGVASGQYFAESRVLATAAHYVVNTEMENHKQSESDRVVTGSTDTANPYDARYDYQTVQPSKIKRIKVYEIYDKIGKRLLMFTSTGILFCMKPFSDMPYLQGSPYVTLRFNILADFYYMDTDFDIHESELYAIDAISNRLLEFTKRMLPKFLARKGAIDRNELNKVIRGVIGGVYEINVPANFGLQDCIQPMVSDNLKPENFQTLNFLQETHSKTSGITDYMKGQGGAAKTATEAQIVANSASGRAALRQKLFDEAIQETARKLFYVLKHTTEAPKWIAIAGSYPMMKQDDNGATLINYDDATGQPVMNKQHGFYLTKDMLQADFHIKIEAGSTSLNNQFQKQAMLLNLFKLVGNSPLVNQAALLRKIVQAYDEDPDELIMEQPPLQQALGQAPNMNPQGTPIPQPAISSNQTVGDMAGRNVRNMKQNINANTINPGVM